MILRYYSTAIRQARRPDGTGRVIALQKLAITSCVLAICAAGAQEGLLEGPDGVLAITRPSKDVTLSFVRSGLVAEVLVEDGQAVKAGQVLIRQDDQAEQVQLEQLKAEAADEIRIEAAKANLDLKTVELEKMRKAAGQGGATELEVRSAEVSQRIQQLTLDNEHFRRDQDRRKYEEARIQLDRMKIASPIDGMVEGVAVKAGEGTEASQKIIRVVRIDPLWIDVPVDLAKAREQLRTGQAAQVAFTRLDGKVEYASGAIIKIGSVADAASGTLGVRVEVANPSSRPAGEHVSVSFPPAKATAGEGGSDREVSTATAEIEKEK